MTRIKSTLFIAALALSSTTAWTQGVGINSTNSNADASAMLDISASDKGILIPRIALTGTGDATTISSPTTSLLVYNSASVSDVTPGFYYWNGTIWVRITSGADQGLWTENAGKLFPTTLSNDVGINTNSPEHELHVNGDIGFGNGSNGYIYYKGDVNTAIKFTDERYQLFVGSLSSSWIDVQNSVKEIAINENGLQRDFRIEGDNLNNLFFADGSTDNIGIGTSTPAHRLHVNAGTYTGTDAAAGVIGNKAFIGHGNNGVNDAITAFQGLAQTNTWESFTTDVTGVHGKAMANGTDRTPTLNLVGVYGEAEGEAKGIQTAIGGKFSATGGTNNYALITENGNVGLNTAAPTEQLDVDGQIRMRTGATNGYIVQGNANGVMSWIDPASITSSSAWSLTGNAGTTPGTNFLGTTDAQNLQIKSNNTTRLTIESGGDVNLASNSIFRAATAGGAHILGAQGNTPANPAIGFHSTSGFYPQDGAGGLGIYRPDANILAFATQSTERMRISSNGNVGIGTNAPSQQLHVKGISRFQRADADNYLEISADINGVYLTSDDPSNNQKPLYLDAKPSPTDTKPIYMRTNNTTRMTVHGDGNVGIGVTSPSYKLHVNGGTATGTADRIGAYSEMGHGGGSGTSTIRGFRGRAWTNSWSGTNTAIGVHGLGDASSTSGGGATTTSIGLFGEATGSTSGTQTAIGGKFTATGADNNYALITENGNVGINTATPSYQFDVQDNTSSLFAARIYNTNTGTDADGLRIQLARSTAPNSQNYYVGFYSGTGTTVATGSTFRGGIRGNGSGISYATTSDGRLKQDIVNIDGALSIVDKMQPRHYSYIANPEAKEYGFIAQELQKVYPQAVAGNPEDDIEVDGPMMVDYGRLTPILTAAVKELNVKLTAEQEAHKASKQEVETLKEDLKGIQQELSEIKALLKANGLK